MQHGCMIAKITWVSIPVGEKKNGPESVTITDINVRDAFDLWGCRKYFILIFVVVACCGFKDSSYLAFVSVFVTCFRLFKGLNVCKSTGKF